MTLPVVPSMRIGEGWDTHQLVIGRPLVLGGVAVPHSHGLLGHSDADALLHAITDALLGAAGLGDIGRHFPDTDPAYKGADSVVLLQSAAELVRSAGWAVVNVDSTIIAQARAHRAGPGPGGRRRQREGQDRGEVGPGRRRPGHRGACHLPAAAGLRPLQRDCCRRTEVTATRTAAVTAPAR